MNIKGIAASLGGFLLFATCANISPAEAGNLSSAEKILRHHGSNAALTTFEGTMVGGAVGCGLGFLAANTNGCIKGAIGGGVAGVAAGLYVASRAQAAKETEDQYAGQIVQANKDAASAQQVVNASQTIVNDATQKINALKSQLHSQQITLAQYNQKVSRFQQDRELLVQNIADVQKQLNSTNYLIAAKRGTAAQQEDLQKARMQLQAALKQQQEQANNMQALIAVS
ncbi:hypothetical protein [Komagataeibacter sp. FNDCR2]|uniref:hypothetical protein n=1 Tax=Komagataeibacter sp. FNDCR2 TaxID=2878682 RepID=UPI001E58B657|nr:hypothetical protein [Komagataeibacter sp. FNDCR2]MCE2574131.1 hypothetical protein [Komagataeibacter sp. FNDCR2]